MYSDLLRFRNELKNKYVAAYKLVGIVSTLLFSKEIFKANKDILPFLETMFVEPFSASTKKSRPAMVGKASKLILSNKDTSILKKKLVEFISIKIEELKSSPTSTN